MKYWLVMPAAGAGRRFGESIPKQYAPLAGRTVIEWALAPFLADSRCAGILLALSHEDRHWRNIADTLPPIVVVMGGAERCQTVSNALNILSSRATLGDWVLVHDAARPCLTSHDLNRLVETLADHPVGGLLATPLADTLKRAHSVDSANAPPIVDHTVERAGLWRALTPQMFRFGRLREALHQASAAHRQPTDEAQAIEWLGERPVLVAGAASNIKITSRDDLVLAEAILAARKE